MASQKLRPWVDRSTSGQVGEKGRLLRPLGGDAGDVPAVVSPFLHRHPKVDAPSLIGQQGYPLLYQPARAALSCHSPGAFERDEPPPLQRLVPVPAGTVLK